VKFHHCCPLMGSSFWFPLEKFTIGPPWKNPSGVQVRNTMTQERTFFAARLCSGVGSALACCGCPALASLLGATFSADSGTGEVDPDGVDEISL